MSTTVFEFTNSAFEVEKRLATFQYKLTGDGKDLTFKETVQFPTNKDIVELPEPLLKHLLDTLHLVLGISYWKMYAPRTVSLPSIRLTKEQSKFWTTLYTYGMGEFFYKNKMDFHNYLEFPYDNNYIHDYFELNPSERVLIGIGGGKDSIVSAELIKKHYSDSAAFTIENEGQQHIVDDVIEAIGLPAFKVKRTLDSQLKTLPDTLKGHIPVSAIYAFLGVVSSILYDFKYYIVSNEHSANYGNVEYLGETINHQWSKTLMFEKMVQQYVHTSISSEIEYFSLLRPFTELKIVQLFAQYPKYFPLFTSCNRNFRINPEQRLNSRWCGECAKCAFAFIMLAAFLPEKEIITIFGKNLFEDDTMVSLYRELLGIKDIKPFDCVGTPDEVSVAFMMAKTLGSFKETKVMTMFETEVLPKIQNGLALKDKLFEPVPEHAIPKAMLPVIAEV